MATASGSSASHGFPKRLRPGLPLIPCKCRDETKIVMEYRVKKEGPNKDHIFYKCPDRVILSYLMIMVSLYLFS